MNKLSDAIVLLPTYNEITNLGQIVPDILAAAPVDIMVLDDASPDGTGAVADQLAINDKRVTVVHRSQKAGLGAAYLDGFSRALQRGYDCIIEMDADYSHDPQYLSTMLKLAKTADVVLGSRWTEGGDTKNWPLARQIISRVGSWYARTILGLDIQDLTGGFKCFRRQVLESFDLSDIQSTGFAFQIEITYLAIQKGFKVVEMPIMFADRVTGVSKMSLRIALEALTQVPMLRLRQYL